jgi:hypothetical protein
MDFGVGLRSEPLLTALDVMATTPRRTRVQLKGRKHDEALPESGRRNV